MTDKDRYCSRCKYASMLKQVLPLPCYDSSCRSRSMFVTNIVRPFEPLQRFYDSSFLRLLIGLLAWSTSSLLLMTQALVSNGCLDLEMH